MSFITRELRKLVRRSAKRAIRLLTRSSERTFKGYLIMAITLPIIMGLFTMLLAWLRGKYGLHT